MSVTKIFEHIGAKIKIANPWINSFAVNCVQLPKGQVVNFVGEEKTEVGFDDSKGHSFYIRTNPKFAYSPQRQLSSSMKEYRVRVPFTFVFFSVEPSIEEGLELDPFKLENNFATNFRQISFSDYFGSERQIEILIKESNPDFHSLFLEETKIEFNSGSKLVAISIKGELSFLSSNDNCESECYSSTSTDILQSFDFCDPAVLARLCSKQIECLKEEFGNAGGGVWGGITGNIQDQEDLMNILSGLQGQINEEEEIRSDYDILLQNQINQLNENKLECEDLENCETIQDIILSIQNEAQERSDYDALISQALTDHENDFSNPHNVTLEQARSENSTIDGDINANTNTIINIRDAVNPQEPITKMQFDTYVSAVGGQRGEIDCSANPNYPASNLGDRWEVIVAGKIGGALGINVQVYDEIVCKNPAGSPGGSQAAVGADFYVVQGNLERATEIVSGYTSLATIAEAEAGLDDTKAITSLKLAAFWTYVKTQVQTFAAKITFTLAPRFSSTTANQYLKVDANKDLTSVPTIPAADVAESATKVFVPPSVADNDFLVGDSATNRWLKKTLAEAKIILGLSFGSTAGTYAEGNDSRFGRLYTWNFGQVTTFLNSSNYFFGSLFTVAAGTTAAGNRRIYFHEACTITGFEGFFLVNGALGSSDNNTISIRIDNATDHLVSNTVTLDAMQVHVSSNALNIPVAANSFMEIKLSTKTTGTAPTNILGTGTVRTSVP